MSSSHTPGTRCHWFSTLAGVLDRRSAVRLAALLFGALLARRPSHADKRRAWRRELLMEELNAVLPQGANNEKIQEVAERLVNLAA